MTSVEVTTAEVSEVEGFAGTLFTAAIATMELANVELGIRLGLYEALWHRGPQTSDELADATGTVERYIREWLEQQAVAGVLEVDEPDKPPPTRIFSLPNSHAHVLLDDDSEACMKPCAAVATFVARSVEIMTEEFSRGAGVAFGEFGVHDLQAAFTRPVFRHHLVQNWLPALPDVQAKLRPVSPSRSLTSVAEQESRRSLSLTPIRRHASTASTWTRRRSGRRRTPLRVRGLPSGCTSRYETRAIPPFPAATTWSWPSR
jgi:hypothetical protein